MCVLRRVRAVSQKKLFQVSMQYLAKWCHGRPEHQRILFENLHILENLIAIENGIGLRKTLAAMVRDNIEICSSPETGRFIKLAYRAMARSAGFDAGWFEFLEL